VCRSFQTVSLGDSVNKGKEEKAGAYQPRPFPLSVWLKGSLHGNGGPLLDLGTEIHEPIRILPPALLGEALPPL
jgi:hypothetical protein